MPSALVNASQRCSSGTSPSPPPEHARAASPAAAASAESAIEECQAAIAATTPAQKRAFRSEAGLDPAEVILQQRDHEVDRERERDGAHQRVHVAEAALRKPDQHVG